MQQRARVVRLHPDVRRHWQLIDQLVAALKDFDEAEHPRDDDGKFSESGGGGSGSKTEASGGGGYSPKWGTSKKGNVQEAEKLVKSLGYPTQSYSNPKANGAAYYSDGKIHINAAHKFWSNPVAKMKEQGKYLSSDHPNHVVVHEIGHALYDPPDNFMALKHQDIAREQVSKYAAMNPKEFVSEVYAGRQAGKSYSDEVNTMFKVYAKKRS
jgi:hypothetical protein